MGYKTLASVSHPLGHGLKEFYECWDRSLNETKKCEEWCFEDIVAKMKVKGWKLRFVEFGYTNY